MSLKFTVGSIPLYRADRSLCALVSDRQLRQLDLAGLVARVVRSRKGRIERAVLFAQAAEPTPRAAAALMSTRYSFNEQLHNGSQCWKLSRLDAKDEDGNAIDGRKAFQTVVESCIV